MKKLFLFLCLLAPIFAHGEEVSVSLDMSYDKAIELLQKCGGVDATAGKEVPPQIPGTYWWLANYGVQVAISQHYGKINGLSYCSKQDLGISKLHETEAERSAQSITFDTEKNTFSAQTITTARKPPTLPARWNVRVEMLIVAVPQEKALSMLPDLRDETKIESAYAQIMEAIQRKEARLIGYPFVYTLDGERATAETIFEKLYPTQFQPPQIPQNFGNTTTVTTTTTATDDPQKAFLDGFPTSFEKRNLGVTLEVEPNVREGGKLIHLNLYPQQVVLEGFDSYEAVRGPGVTVKVEQPRFFTTKQSASLLIRNGQRLLFGMHQSNQPGQTELYILQASAALPHD